MDLRAAGWFPDPDDASQLRYWNGSAWTEHRGPRGHAVAPASPAPPPLPPSAPGPTGKWYFVITIASVGLLAAVPFFHAASRLDRPQLRKTGAWMAAAGVLGCALVGVSPTDDTGQPTGWLSTVGALILLVVMLVATLQLIGLRREVYQDSVGVQAPTVNQAAMARVEEARRKRDEARRLALRDPMMARELGIGRPRAGQGYDDGGLLDLNSATPEQFSALCGLPRDVAEAVVASRSALGRFQYVDDAIRFGQIGEEYAPTVRDRGIIIPD